MPFDLQSPVTPSQLAQLDDRPQFVQFSSALLEPDYRLLGEWIRDRPSVTLRAYGSYDGSITNLDFLRWFPSLKRFQVDVYSLQDIDGLRCLPEDAEVLGLGLTKKRLSLSPLSRFTALRRLFLEGHTKDLDVLARLETLVDLTLRSITLPDLEILQPLEHLRALDLKLGGTTNLALLPAFSAIRYLELWQIRGLDDISPVAQLPNLEYLFLQSLRRVDRLADFSESISLRRIWLETMKGLSDIEDLATARSLQHVALIDMPQLAPEALLPVLDCPALRSARVGLGSNKKNARAHELLGDLVTDDWKVWDPTEYRYV